MAFDPAFIYDIDWDETTGKKAYFTAEGRSINFKPGAARNLVVLANLLRPLIQRRWAALIAQINSSVLDESLLDRFLFDPERERPRRLLDKLSKMQDGGCFYCAQPPSSAHIDHFLPWSLSGDDGLDNYVIAGGKCNLDKSASLPAAVHVERWAQRLRDGDASREYDSLSTEAGWPRRPARTLGLARSLYLGSASSKLLWESPGEYKLLQSERSSIQGALA